MKRFLANTGFLESFASENTHQALASAGDIALGQLLEDGGILSTVPIFGTVLQFYKLGTTVQEQFAIAKLEAFLEKGKTVSQTEKDKFLKKLVDDKKNTELGTQLFILLQKAEDLDKPRIYGNFLEACMKEHFDVSTLSRLCKMVDRAFYEDFEYLANLYNGNQQHRDQDIEQSLNAAGFLRHCGMDEGTLNGLVEGHIKYETNTYGQWLVELGLSEGDIPEPETTNTLFS